MRIFFFSSRRRHTRCSRDWSSDVCSSDLGTCSSRKSATNSIVWATGQDIPFVPNKRFGGVTLGGKIAPIFFNTQEDSGSLPIEVDVTKLEMEIGRASCRERV